MPPIRFQFILAPFGKRCLKYFKRAAIVAILDIRTERFKQFWISMSPQYLPLNFSALSLSAQEKILFEHFKMATMGHEDFIDRCHGGRLGYRNGAILAIKYHHVDQISAQSDFLFGRCRLNYFKMAAAVAILDIGTERL